MEQESLFSPQRTLGLVCARFPFYVHTEGQRTFLSLPLSNTFQTYYTDRLQIRYIGPALDRTVNAVAAYQDLILAASGTVISAWHKVKQVHTYTGSVSAIADLFVFGDYVLALNFSAQMLIWNAESEALLQTIPLPHPGVCLAHPPTYLNKVLVAMKRELCLFNVKTGAKIYSYPELGKLLKADISCMDTAPALDLVGVGLCDGTIIVWDVKTDTGVLELRQETGVTSLSFATGSDEFLATSDEKGLIHVWNLPERRLHVTIPAHAGYKIDKIQFLPKEPVLVSSSGAQNSLKQYIFEEGHPRLLRERSGFSSPPVAMKFYDDKHILACSDRQLRDLSLLNEHQSSDFSYKLIHKVFQHSQVATALKPFRALACSSHRERDWCNVLTCHFQTEIPILWSYEDKVVGTKPVELKNLDSEVTAVEVSQCGTFGLAGLLNGKIEKFTMQSGMHFLEFQGQHEGQVTGLKSDAMNRVLVSAGADGQLKFWSFAYGKLIHEVSIGSPIQVLELDRQSYLLAVATSAQVRLYDIRTFQLAREFEIEFPTALAFSSESRWLAASAGLYIYLWDIPSSRLVDWIQFETRPIALSFSPVGNYLATCHQDSLGVFLWRNRAFAEDLIIDSSPVQPRLMTGFDVAQGKDFYTTKPINIEALTSESVKMNVALAMDTLPSAPEHNDVQLSSVPHSRVMALDNIDAIKERNKPIQPPKKGNVPFFLPDSLSIVKSGETQEERTSHVLKEDIAASDLVRLMELSPESMLEHLKTLSPSKLELDIMQLRGQKELSLMTEFFIRAVEMKKDFDFVQSLLKCFLRVHGPGLMEECKTELKLLKDTQCRVWKALEDQFMRDISGLARAAGLVTG